MRELTKYRAQFRFWLRLHGIKGLPWNTKFFKVTKVAAVLLLICGCASQPPAKPKSAIAQKLEAARPVQHQGASTTPQPLRPITLAWDNPQGQEPCIVELWEAPTIALAAHPDTNQMLFRGEVPAGSTHGLVTPDRPMGFFRIRYRSAYGWHSDWNQ